jgi:DNA modification methylase
MSDSAIKNRILKTELVDIDRLTPFQGKLKTLSDANFNKLRKSIMEEGFSFTVHVWENADVTYIIDGHQRVSVLHQMRKQGIMIPPISCSFVSAKTYRDAKKLVLLAISQYGKIQKDGFLEFVDGEDFDFTDYDFPDLSFDLDGLFDKPKEEWDESKEDEIPEDAPTRVKPGDIWKLGEHRLMCGDSTHKGDVEKLFAGAKAALCFTSPPYADQREYKGGKELSTEHLATFIASSANLVELFAVNLGLARRDHEVIQYWDDYIKNARESGLKLLSWNVWDKGEAGSIGNQNAMFAISHEWIFVFGKKTKKLKRTIPNKSAGYLANHNGNRQADGSVKKTKDMIIQEFSQLKTVYEVTAQKARDEIDHPARFPVEFPFGYIEACTEKEDHVYEPFCGSGTTLIAAEKTGRKCLGMEIDPGYCDIILARWEKMTGKTAERVSHGG